MFEELKKISCVESREWYNMGLENGAVSCDFKSLEGSACGFTALPNFTT